MRGSRGLEALQDSLVIGFVVLLSAALYVGQLGFYTDDWAFNAHFALGGPDLSYRGLLRRSFEFPSMWERPFNGIYAAGLFWLFGLEPLGYQLVNTGVILAGAVLLYLVFRELGQSRLIALSVPLVYALLPHYATDRFFYCAFHIPLSMTCYVLSLYADLRAVRTAPGGRWPWRSLAILSLLVSILSYEIFLPLFFLNPLLVWYRGRKILDQWRVPLSSTLLLAGAQMLIVVAVSIFKATVADRMPVASVGEHLAWFSTFLAQAVSTILLGDFGLRVPVVLASIARDYPEPLVFAVAAVLGATVAGYLIRVAGADPAEGDGINHAGMGSLVACGLVIFVAGYSIFLAAFNAAVATTGMNNRTAMAAALGVALALVGVVGWACAWLPSPRWRRGLFCAIVAAICSSGFIVVNTLARFWAAAAERQQLVLQDIRARVPRLPSGSTLMLDGVCPYIGPAPVFETSWDLTGALRLLYDDQTVRGDVITPKVQIRPDGLYTRMYGRAVGPYPYAKLLVYNYGRKTITTLPGPYAAIAYFRDFNPTRGGGCRPSREGFGEPLFVAGEPGISLSP